MKAQRRQSGRGGYRKGAGRKPFLDRARTITVTLEANEYEAVGELAKRRGQSFAAVTRVALKGYLNRQKKG